MRALILLLIGVLLGFGLNEMLARTARYSVARFPVAMDPDFRQKEVVQLPPMEFKVRIVARSDFQRWGQDPVLVRAFTILNINPCEIILPAGWYLEANARSGFVRFMNPDNVATLGHEILHCAAGRWHKER